MRSEGARVVSLVLVCCNALVCCDDRAEESAPATTDGGGIDGARSDSAIDSDTADAFAEDAARSDAHDAFPDVNGLPANLRVMAANISSGPSLNYGPIEGVHLFQGLHPDVVMLQEFNSGGNSKPEIDAFVASTFGPTFAYYREPNVMLPNGIISRFPIAASGSWTDPDLMNRGFAYAKIALTGGRSLWAVSLHLLTTSGASRSTEAAALVTQIKATIPANDYLVVGGDLNTNGSTEGCITTLAEVVVTAAPIPDDGAGNPSTNAPRNKHYDWVFANPDLEALHVPTTLGTRSFAAGLVFDSRVYAPLSDVAPIVAGDSAAMNMQHMPVVKDFHIPE